ncbi:uncharacterized protein LOC119304241 isoform X1 [Triticum dicoccoides]|uniref:uncharacterized protein LOC119304241 isoform X1 n=1 Tax=Triticum dicoccoides TaxID=85692 RepID=UPI00188E3B36|nr:uncharacterized protein LOC119304241 isoform X1 [Triticum dicoccoides]
MEAAGYRSRVVAEVDPRSEWVHGDEFDTLIVDVSAFFWQAPPLQVPLLLFQPFLRELNPLVPNTFWHIDTHAAVAGFARDQLKVQVEPLGSLKISGERALNGGRQWCHFLKRFDLPGACDAAAIKVQLDKGVLYVQVPRSTDDSQEDALREEDWSGGHTAAWRADEHPARRLAKSLGEHRYAVLNVVLAVVLLWLVAFANSKQSGGQIKNE